MRTPCPIISRHREELRQLLPVAVGMVRTCLESMQALSTGYNAHLSRKLDAVTVLESSS
jgi:hypothetical protein